MAYIAKARFLVVLAVTAGSTVFVAVVGSSLVLPAMTGSPLVVTHCCNHYCAWCNGLESLLSCL